jgi:hypothetical protein
MAGRRFNTSSSINEVARTSGKAATAIPVSETALGILRF